MVRLNLYIFCGSPMEVGLEKFVFHGNTEEETIKDIQAFWYVYEQTKQTALWESHLYCAIRDDLGKLIWRSDKEGH